MVVKSECLTAYSSPQSLLSAHLIETESLVHSHSAHFFSISISLSLFLSLSLMCYVEGSEAGRERGGSSVQRSSHHLWNFRARPRWKGVLCPPEEECPCVVSQRKGFIWPGIWRHLEKCRGDFLRCWDGQLKAFFKAGLKVRPYPETGFHKI